VKVEVVGIQFDRPFVEQARPAFAADRMIGESH